MRPSLVAVVPSRPSAEDDAFETELGSEILRAETFRSTLLASIATSAVFALVVGRAAYPEAVRSVLHGNFDVTPVGLFLIGVAGFELFMLTWMKRMLVLGGRAFAPRRYGQAFVETSLPTVAILYYAAVDGPMQALAMPSAFVYSIFILLSTLRLEFGLSLFTGTVAAGQYALIAIFAGSNDGLLPQHLAKAAILFVSGVAAGFVARRLRASFTRAIESVRERQRILGVFGEHVSPEVARQLVTGTAEAKTELRDICVMFLDIRSFTSFAENHTPTEVVDYLNTVFAAAIDAVVSRHGIVNKFLGDGFMAIFGAPIVDSDARGVAIDAALDIVARVERLVADGTLPPTRVGIGLHAGTAVVGNIGSAHRKEYTVIGDVVNVASRVEALNKELGTSVLASDDVWSAVQRPDIQAIAHDEIALRGRSEAIRIWQLA